MEIGKAIRAQSKNANDLMRLNNVVGVAVGEKQRQGEGAGQQSVVVLVNRKLPISALSVDDVLPKTIDDVAVDVVEIGYPRAYNNPKDKFLPPIPAGISTGHYQITAGTFGATVKDKKTGDLLLLSNNHVFANSNNADDRDNIFQPGPYDGGTQSDSFAWLERFIPLQYMQSQAQSGELEGYGLAEFIRDFGNKLLSLSRTDKRLCIEILEPPPPEIKVNIVDAAVARPYNPNNFSEAILNIGKVSGTKFAELNQEVRKMGRTTGYTEGKIILLNAAIDVGYGSDGVARFQNQIIISDGSFSQGGDSGSLVVDKNENKAVGLLFAGSDVATIANPIDLVLQELNITI